MTITILSRTPEKKIARPWSRGCTKNEVVELLQHLQRARTARGELVKVIRPITLTAIDTDEPVLVIESAGKRNEFYGYTDHSI